MNFAKISVKRVIKYSIVAIVYYPLLLYIHMDAGYRIMFMFTLIAFFVFEGTLIEKISINIIAESTWCALGLLSKIVFGDTIEALVPPGESQNILLDLISLVILSCVVCFLNKAEVFDQDMVKKRVTSPKQQVGMIVLAIEGDIVLFIAQLVYDNHLRLIMNEAVSGFVLCIAGLYLICFALSLDNTMAKEYYKVVNKTLEAQIKSQYSYYQKLERVTKETRAIKHDMKNHLIVMKGMAEKGDTAAVTKYIENIQSAMENMSIVIHTGNSIVDSIVNEKLEIAQSKEIEMKIDVAVQEDIGIPAMDLCVMVANSLDNAIEACDKMQPGSKKVVSIYGRYQHGYLSFIISNTVGKNVYISNNTIITDKVDKLNHGYGLQNIKNSVKRNHGKFKIECQDDVFTVYIDIEKQRS